MGVCLKFVRESSFHAVSILINNENEFTQKIYGVTTMYSETI